MKREKWQRRKSLLGIGIGLEMSDLQGKKCNERDREADREKTGCSRAVVMENKKKFLKEVKHIRNGRNQFMDP